MSDTLSLFLGGGTTYVADRRYDPDIFEAHASGGDEAALALALTVCRCGHPRHQHAGATGSLAAFGGSACDLCWSCGTFVAAT